MPGRVHSLLLAPSDAHKHPALLAPSDAHKHPALLAPSDEVFCPHARSHPGASVAHQQPRRFLYAATTLGGDEFEDAGGGGGLGEAVGATGVGLVVLAPLLDLEVFVDMSGGPGVGH